MSRPVGQRIALFVVALVAGAAGLGVLLDSVGNALALVTWPITVVGSIALVAVIAVAEVVLRTRGLRWNAGGQQTRLKGLGVQWHAGVAGMILLLWVPPAVQAVRHQLNPQPDSQTDGGNATAGTDPSSGDVPLPPAQPPNESGNRSSAPADRAADTLASAAQSVASTPPEDEIFVQCSMGLMPAIVPPSGRIPALVVQPTPVENGGGGLADLLATPGVERKWTNEDKQPAWAYRCDVTNYSERLLIDVEIDVHYTLTEPVAVPDQPKAMRHGRVMLDRDWTILIPKVDKGPDNPFTFYIWNCCQQRFVTIRFPDNARLKSETVGTQIKKVRIRQPTGNLAQDLMPVPFAPMAP